MTTPAQQQQLLKLFATTLQEASHIIANTGLATTPAPEPRPKRARYEALVWDVRKNRVVCLGAFDTADEAMSAQQDYISTRREAVPA